MPFVAVKKPATRKPPLWQRLAWTPLLLAMIVGCFALPVRGDRISPDARQNLAAAANLVQEGFFSTFFEYRGRLEDPVGVSDVLEPDHRREPMTAWLMVPFLATETDEWQRDCLVNADQEWTCADTMRRVKLVNVLLLMGFALLARLLAISVGFERRWAWGIALVAALSPTMVQMVDDTMNTLPTAVLLTAIGVVGPAALRRNPVSWPHVGLLGVLSGLLILTRSINAIVLLAIVVAVLAIAARRRDGSAGPLARRIGAAVLAAVVVVAPWVVRNSVVLDDAAVAGGSELVLAVRAEATRFTPVEYLAAFPAYTPELGRTMLRNFFEPEDWQRWRRRIGPTSFFEEALGYIPGGEVQRRAGPGATSDEVRAAAIDLAIEEWPKSVALTGVYTYRGLYMYPRAAALENHESGMIEGYAKLVELPANLLHYLGWPFAVWMVWRALRRRDTALLATMSPALATFAVYGAFTHFIPRYNESLVAYFYVLLALAAVTLLKPDGALVAADAEEEEETTGRRQGTGRGQRTRTGGSVR